MATVQAGGSLYILSVKAESRKHVGMGIANIGGLLVKVEKDASGGEKHS